MRRGRVAALGRLGATSGLVLGLAAGLTLAAWGALGEDPAAEVTQALRGLGPPGLLWGRLLVEEESPEGAWTPLAGVEVTLYPATPALLAELERIRQSARTSAAEHESAGARLQAALAAHQARVDAQSAGTPLARLKPDPAPDSDGLDATESPPRALDRERPPDKERPAGKDRAAGKDRPADKDVTRSTGPKPAGEVEGPPRPVLGKHPFQQATDPAGLFAFPGVPAGDWAVLAVRVAPYDAAKLRAEVKPRSPSRTRHFTARTTGGPPREVEIWLGRVRLGPDERVSLTLTDRARWFVGPVR